MITTFDRESESIEAIRQWLEWRSAIHFPENKRDILHQRLMRVVNELQLPNLGELARRVLQEQVHEVQLAVLHAASTNHTYFYREVEVLHYFQQVVLPNLANRSEIRLWSAACSTGDEVFTLAILVAETLGKAALKRTQILGTDISAPCVAHAETGIYAARHLDQVPLDIRNRYMVPIGNDKYQMIPEIREVCTFRRINLKTPTLPFRKPFQAVLCRNVLYYFSVEDQRRTVDAIADVTEVGGWMFTSVTEGIRDLSTRWHQISSGVHQKRAEA
jgi:chemotaxis protein methyltransferase CheR